MTGQLHSGHFAGHDTTDFDAKERLVPISLIALVRRVTLQEAECM